MFSGMKTPAGDRLGETIIDSHRVGIARGGISMVEVLMIALIVVVLVAMTMPMLSSWVEGDRHRRTNDGNNLKQILGATIAYGQEQECAWPLGISPACSLPALN